MCHLVLFSKNVSLLPSLENFQMTQTTCYMLTVTFSNLTTNDREIVNPPVSFRTSEWKYHCLPTKEGTTNKSTTISAKCTQQLKKNVQVQLQGSKYGCQENMLLWEKLNFWSFRNVISGTLMLSSQLPCSNNYRQSLRKS